MPKIIPTEDIRSLSDFRSNVSSFISHVRESKRPMILTQARVWRLTAIARRLRWIPWFDRKLAVLPSVAEIQGLAAGIPTSEPMRSLYWAIGAPPPTMKYLLFSATHVSGPGTTIRSPGSSFANAVPLDPRCATS